MCKSNQEEYMKVLLLLFMCSNPLNEALLNMLVFPGVEFNLKHEQVFVSLKSCSLSSGN